MTAEQDGNPFSGAWLERRAQARDAADWAAQALAEADTLFLVASGTRHLVRRGAATAIAFLDATHPLVRAADPAQLLLLGWFEERRCVLLEALPGSSDFPDDTQFEELRPLLTELPEPQAALLTCARALQIWRERHRHCGTCGAPTAPRQAGHCLRCTSSTCGAEYFPRLDPAVIVLVSDGEHALLGRQAAWPAGRYSTLAGFRRSGREPGGHGGARGARGNRRARGGSPLLRLAALALPRLADARLPCHGRSWRAAAARR